MTYLLIISLLGTSTPMLIIPMADARSCNINRDIIAHHLTEGTDARCYNLARQNWDFRD